MALPRAWPPRWSYDMPSGCCRPFKGALLKYCRVFALLVDVGTREHSLSEILDTADPKLPIEVEKLLVIGGC